MPILPPSSVPVPSSMPSHAPRRPLFMPALRLILRHPAPLLWTYVFNLVIALLFSLRLHAQLSSILNHSLAAQNLTSAFDLGTAVSASLRISHNAPTTGLSSYLGIPLYFVIYFLLVPGTLLAYNTASPTRLSTLFATGLDFFWRFLRILLLTVLASAILLGPLAALQSRWSDHISAHTTGLSALVLQLLGVLLLLLIAALLRLYFDLVEVYTIQLGRHLRLPCGTPEARPDRRVRRTLLPALRTLFSHFAPIYAIFLVLTLIGLAAFFLLARVAVHMLAQPRVWPMFLLAQLGLFLMLLTRFWQRAAETLLALDNPLPAPRLSLTMPLPAPPDSFPPSPAPPVPAYNPADAQSDPEPAVPSLSEPDPGIFHPPSQNPQTITE